MIHSSDEMEHLFRRESGRMVAAITRVVGVHNLALAEDVVQDVFCRALEVWSLRGVPENPAAWLTTAAKRRAIDVLRRERTAREFAPELGRALESEWTLVPTVEEMFDAGAIRDSLLRMMFSCCDPRLSEEAQVALVLHILCGFSVGEIAGAFVSGHAAIEKRITRAKKVLAESGRLFDVGVVEDVVSRLPAVRRALYLLFNEGYHGASAEFAVRGELCREAMRLTGELLGNEELATPETLALAALMHLHAARLAGRMDAEGNLHALADQDRGLWDREMLEEGERLLELSARGEVMSEYHVEAAIAAVHGSARTAEETKWGEIVALYDMLMRIRSSPIVALNRAIAIGQCEGAERGLAELRAIDAERLKEYPFYFAALGEFEMRRGERESARRWFERAAGVARNDGERKFFEGRSSACETHRH